MKINFFESYLKDLYEQKKIDSPFPDEKGNVRMCCPFPHTSKKFNPTTWEEETIEYYEDVPSSSINLDMRVFHCFTCNRTFKEIEFAQQITNKTEDEIIKEFATKEELKSVSQDWKQFQHKALIENAEVISKLHDLKITDDIIEQLNLGYMTNCLAIPVFKKEDLINIARYNINKLENIPKVQYNKNANSGDIIPFNIWKDDDNPTIICEGEKDMLVARSHGFNAITLTGGSQSSLQKEYFNYFKDRKVFICYDNDDAGRKGSIRMYKDLKQYCDVYITDISTVCIENKEDITDFFVKYNKSAKDLINILKSNSTKPSEEDLKEVKSKYEIELSKLETNVSSSSIDKSLRSILQIVAVGTETYSVPKFAMFKPTHDTNENDEKLETRSWYLDSSKENFLLLMEGKVKKEDIPNTLARLCNLSNKWNKDYILERQGTQTIYRVAVTDQAKENDEKAAEFTIDLYSKKPLGIGNIYDIRYRLFPHPRDGQKIIAIAEDIKETEYSFDYNNNDYLESLDKFKVTADIDSKIEELYQSARCHIAPYLNKDLWFLMDLVFNSPLDITYKNVIRGALDIFVLGDTRTGKSETSRALKSLYDFGEVVPLKTATVASLIGGTDDKMKKTKLGILPRYHKELVVLEEFSGAPVEFIKTLTEIRSSSMVKIYRVAGDIQAPCKLRMITISNPISESGNMMTLSSFPNGIEPLNELIRSPEDIARYDAFFLLPRVESLTNPFSSVINENYKIDNKHYQHKSRWIKSLNENNVIISNDLGKYIFEKSIELNEMFECSFSLFGSETDKKVARMSAALACMLCDTDDYKNIKVEKDHVDYIVKFLKSIYDNPIFRLKEFATEEKSYNIIVEEDKVQLESYYPNNVTFIDFLANTSKVNRNELMTVSGLNKDDFSKMFNFLVARKFVKLAKDMVVPTLKFRNTYRIMNKTFNLNDEAQSLSESVF